LIAKGHNPSYRFRGHKADIYEGGHRVPFFVRWPGKVKPGTKYEGLASLVDITATCADAVGAKLPDSAAEDSISLLPALGMKKGPVRENVIMHSINGSFAIRKGKWKLCLCPGSGGWSAPRPGVDDTSKLPRVQLFDLDSDIGEKSNLQDHHPDIVKGLTALLEKQAAGGRSTPGQPQANTTPVDVWKGGQEAKVPPKKKKKK
jgi:arylsulfatase A-like enzyme